MTYTSLYLVRLLEITLRRLLGSRRPNPRGAGGWNWSESHIITRLLKGILNLDFQINRFLGKFGLDLPGLSICLICHKKVGLIVPCHNEAERLDFSHYDNVPKTIYFVFVNDGSNDATAARIQEKLSANIFFLDLKRNVGKAEAVRQGMLYLREQEIFGHLDWIGFWDADLATPLSELPDFIRYRNSFCENAESIWACRVARLGSKIQRSFTRHLLARAFAMVAKIVLDAKSYDSQCGAKLFLPQLVDTVFAEPFISRWIFDLEILLRLKGREIVEYPVAQWKDVGGGQFNVAKEFVRVLDDMRQIRKRYWRNRA